MLKIRVLTALAVLPLFVAAMFLLPNPWWSIALVLPLLIAGHEWAKLASFGRNAELLFLAALASGCAVLWALAVPGASGQGIALAGFDRVVYGCGAVFWCVIAPCWLRLKLVVRQRVIIAAAGLMVLLPMWLALAQLQKNPALLLALLAVVWIADTAAYFTGRAFGKHKLAPSISPGKTWEGVGGALAAVAVYAVILHTLPLFSRHSVAIVVASFLAMASFSIVGDLFESWIKRTAHVKDSGSIFPGHGGMLDRIDAVTAALPVAALIFA